MVVVITVFVLVWIWCIWEFANTPTMPDDYGKELDDEWEQEKMLTEYKQRSHGLLGGNLEDVHMRGDKNG